MGQKVNPTSFRLGINKKWQTEFFEKNKSELSLFIFKDLEINNYIQRFFRLKGLIVHDYKYLFMIKLDLVSLKHNYLCVDSRMWENHYEYKIMLPKNNRN